LARSATTCLAFGALGAGLTAAAHAQRGPTRALEPYTEKIAGTLLSFDMVPVPATGDASAFWISRTEVTWDMYDEYLFGQEALPAPPPGVEAIARPSKPYVRPGERFGHDGYPALGMSFHAAQEFARWLSAKTGKTYRLPTEGEWMRACETAQPAPLRDAPGDATHPVGALPPDKLGLHDMLGNVAEWIVAGADSMVAGGSYLTPPRELTCAARMRQVSEWNVTDPQLPKSRWWLTDAPFIGMRLVRGQ
jgi:formylglycine-generating enzyme required for sulfatase activity